MSIFMTTTMTAEPQSNIEALRLSGIYRKLLDDLEGIGFFGSVPIPSEHYDEAIQVISDAFSEAVQVLSQRCEKCDSTNVKVICSDCNE